MLEVEISQTYPKMIASGHGNVSKIFVCITAATTNVSKGM